MRRKIAALLALLAAGLLVFAGCGTKAPQGKPPDIRITAVPGETAEGRTAEEPEESAEAPAEDTAKTPKPTKTPKVTKAPEQTKAPGPTKTPKPTKTPEPAETPAGPITEPQAIADYLFRYGKLPDNFITKAEAQALGWDSSRNYLSDVAPGMSIGGDRFGNYEGQLPGAAGRKFFECDCNYTGGKRGGERIVYSNDGHVWYTGDHYGTFTELFPSK